MISIVSVLVLAFAGVEWQADMVHKEKNKETKTVIKGYAQKGMVREDYVEVGDKNPMTQAGMYWLYNGETNTAYLVDPEKKTYIMVSMDSLAQMMGAIAQLIKTTITNPKIEINQLAPESLLSLECKHFSIVTSYDMETKVLIMKVKSHVEENKELWTMPSSHWEDISFAFAGKSYKTGIAEIDALVMKEQEALGDFGFPLKSITTNKTSDAKGKVSSESTTEMIISGIAAKELDPGLFVIPEDYKQIPLGLKIPGQE
jgi:hypothetical protein